MERCENCGSLLPLKADPLCHSCLSELRAAPYPAPLHNRIEAALARLEQLHNDAVAPKAELPGSAA